MTPLVFRSHAAISLIIFPLVIVAKPFALGCCFSNNDEKCGAQFQYVEPPLRLACLRKCREARSRLKKARRSSPERSRWPRAAPLPCLRATRGKKTAAGFGRALLLPVCTGIRQLPTSSLRQDHGSMKIPASATVTEFPCDVETGNFACRWLFARAESGFRLKISDRVSEGIGSRIIRGP